MIMDFGFWILDCPSHRHSVPPERRTYETIILREDLLFRLAATPGRQRWGWAVTPAAALHTSPPAPAPGRAARRGRPCRGGRGRTDRPAARPEGGEEAVSAR